MKKLIYLGLMLLFGINLIFAQTPESFNYQAVLKNSNGESITSQNVSVKVSILQGSDTGTPVYSETHAVQTSDKGLINLKVGEGEDASSDFSSIDWGASNYFLKIEIDETGDAIYTSLGAAQLLSVPYALHAKAASNLGDDGVYTTASDTLFVVKDHDGNVVFVVFPDGAKIIVNETAKGKVGGFAISGRIPSKADDVDILKVTVDSTRIYINESLAKGKVGGFAISGRIPSKDDENKIEYLRVTTDSTIIFIDNDSTKGKVGGFAISGRIPSKGLSNYFNVSGNNAPVIINPSEPRVVWFPRKEAFWAGRVLIEHPDSVGFNSMAIGYEAVAKGDKSQAFGFQTRARGDYSTAIGYKTEANGNSCFAVGGEERDTAGQLTGGYTMANGTASFALGLGANASGIANTSVGLGSSAVGDFASTAFGVYAQATATRATAIGYGSVASAEQSMAIGVSDTASAYNSLAMGVGSKASGIASIALGSFVEANSPGSFVVGQLNEIFTINDLWSPEDPLFVIGNGFFADPMYPDPITAIRQNALTILKNGNMGVGVDEPTRTLHIKDVMRLEPQMEVPDGEAGCIYYDGIDNTLKFHDGNGWRTVNVAP